MKKEIKTPPTYYVIIPAKVRFSKQISAPAKILYGEILALSALHGFCSASNEYWAKLFDVDDKTVSLWVSQLNSADFIKNNWLKSGERKIYPKIAHLKESIIPSQGSKEGVSGKDIDPQSVKADNNNTSINTIINNNISEDEPRTQDSKEIKDDTINNWDSFLSSSLQRARDGYTYTTKTGKQITIKPNHARYFALYFLKRKGLKFKSFGAVETALGRHFKAGKELSNFISDPKKLSEAFDKAERLEYNGQKVDWDLGTVVKMITK